MKQKDIALIIVIVFFSAVISFVVSNALIATSRKQQQAETVQPITAQFTKPDSKYFNNQAFDPTKPITIGQNANSDPFSGASH